jgi:hypothetical protein
MLNFDDMTPEQKLALSKMSPEIAALFEEEKVAAQQQLDSVFTLEKYREKLKENLAKIKADDWNFMEEKDE